MSGMSLAQAQQAYGAYQQYSELDKQYDITNKAVAAKNAADGFEQQYGLGAAASNAYQNPGASANAAYQSAAGAARQAFSGGGPPASGASLGTGTGLPDQRWKVHCVEKLEGGGRGRMEDAVLVQPAGQFMLFLQLKGASVER
eukprot:CAMPEP_0197612730 /NCGR_PEP_ID=MMETSP1326-20131121/57842_1 /TAXON_ID=1155430 /ORGANISM="Genus nov. species nov., Strain RCC2288" /LENGTH=142 /DNA_ID=CAMNT_0043181517 /DNA_START=33 /DNA_END=458 /DNA_ORIENTATION=+